jgi:hypothetical protein
MLSMPKSFYILEKIAYNSYEVLDQMKIKCENKPSINEQLVEFKDNVILFLSKTIYVISN